jgi:uncharacterized protein YndB with AHSA1/START domain
MGTLPSVNKSVWTTPSDREIVNTRTFAAPRRLVFAAFTDPAHVPNWLLGPDGWSMPICEIDLRVGGSWRYVWRNDSDGREFGMHGVYREIVSPAKIVNTEVFEESEAVNTLELTEVDGGTLMVHTMVMPSKEARDAALATGMTGGADTSYDRLDSYLADQ